MAPEYGVTVATIKNVLKRQGAYPRPKAISTPPKAGTPEYEKQVVELRQSGMRVRDIALTLAVLFDGMKQFITSTAIGTITDWRTFNLDRESTERGLASSVVTADHETSSPSSCDSLIIFS